MTNEAEGAPREAVRREARRYLAFELGDQLYPGEPEYDVSGARWRVPIYSRTLGNAELGHLTIGDDVQVQFAPSREGLRKAASGERFFAGAMSLAYAAASEGHRVLVADRGIEVPVEIAARPEVDAHGIVHCTLRMSSETLSELGPAFSIELIFLPTLDVVVRRRCGAEEIEALQLYAGLELSGPLPASGPLIERLAQTLQQEKLERLKLPRGAFALLIRVTP